MEATRTPTKERRLAALRGALREGSWRGAARMIAAMHPAEIAKLIESLPPAQREVVWNFVEPEIEGDVLVELSEDVRQAFIEGMDADELLAAAEGMELDDLADLVGDLPEAVSLQLVKSMDPQDRERLNTVLSYEPDTAGGLMNTDTVSVRADVTVEVVLRYLRMRGELPDKTDRLFVVDRNDRYLGTVALTRLLTEDPEKPVGDILDPEAPRIAPDTNAHEVAQLFQDRDLVSAAVVDDHRQAAGPHHGRRRGRRHPRGSRARSHVGGRPARRRRRVRRHHPLDAPAPGVAGHQPGHRVPGGGGGQPLRRHHRKSRRARGAHAHRGHRWAASPARRPSR